MKTELVGIPGAIALLVCAFLLGGTGVGLLMNRWEMHIGGPQMPIVWRLDRLTGNLELCYPTKPPDCQTAITQGSK